MQVEKEYAAQISIQVNLKKELHQEREDKHVALEKFKAIEQEARRDRAEFETTIDILRRDLDSSRHAQRLSEARCGDLQVALSLERERFDEAVRHERDILTGMRDRFGLLPRPPRDASEGGAQAVQTRREPWQSVQSKLESKSRQQSQAGKRRKQIAIS
jgi:hypothetical protein